jgi:hypothetical protein
MSQRERPSLLVPSSSTGVLTHLARPRNMPEPVGQGGWQKALRGVNAAQALAKPTKLLRFVPTEAANGKPIEQAVELLVEGRVLRKELGACDEALSEAHERGLSEVRRLQAELKRLGEIETKLRLGCEQAAMIAAAIAPEVKEEREAREAAERAREAAEQEAGAARAEAERLTASEAKLREAAAARDQEHPNILRASKEAADRAAAAEAELLACKQSAKADAAVWGVRLAESQARAFTLSMALGTADTQTAEWLAAARAAGEARAAAMVRAAEEAAAQRAAERVAAVEAECERRTAAAIAAAQADAAAQVAEAKVALQAQLDAKKADLQQQQALLQTNADRAVQELDKGMQAAWQIAEEAEAAKEAALQRVEQLEAALKVALEDDEDDPPSPKR